MNIQELIDNHNAAHEALYEACIKACKAYGLSTWGGLVNAMVTEFGTPPKRHVIVTMSLGHGDERDLIIPISYFEEQS